MEGGQSDSEPDNPHWDWSEEHPYSQYGYSGYYPPYYDSCVCVCVCVCGVCAVSGY